MHGLDLRGGKNPRAQTDLAWDPEVAGVAEKPQLPRGTPSCPNTPLPASGSQGQGKDAVRKKSFALL